jgi:ADP-heptose:LPS heptosyltransferase/GT2 family glycosyltransferase
VAELADDRPRRAAPADLMRAAEPAGADAADRDLRLRIERPSIIGDTALAVLDAPPLIEGWAEARGGVAEIAVYLDGARLDVALHGRRREGEAEHAAFACLCPAARLRLGGHMVRVELRATTGRRLATTFFLAVRERLFGEPPWQPRWKMPLTEIRSGERVLAGLGWRPMFSLLIGIGDSEQEIDAARRTLESLRRQAYGGWRAVVLRRGRTVPADCAERLLAGFDDIADRIDVFLDAPPAASLASLVDYRRDDAPADLIGVLLAGDRLGCDGLLETAIAAGLDAAADLFYGDEYRVNPASGNYEAFFKPQWSPELLTATNYIGRFWCALPQVFARARASAGEWLQFGDYDLALRCTEAAAGIRHIPKLLCQRGRPQLDHPEQERAALRRAAARQGEPAEIMPGALTGYYRMQRSRAAAPLVSIIIATCAADDRIKTCIETLREHTAYGDFEIVCIENIASRREYWMPWLAANADKVVATREPFNWSRFNNLAAAEAAGEVLVFLNDDVEIIAADWLDALLEYALRPEIGAVGARLLYPDRTVQHAGMFWTPDGGRHAFRGAAEAAPGYFGLALAPRNVLMVTGACMAMRRGDFAAGGGFDERHTIVNNDVDYCLRCWERGKRVVYTPHAVLIHHELASRRGLDDRFDEAAFAARWGRRLAAGDPFYHPLLRRDRDDYAYDLEAVEVIHPGGPLLDGARIRNILVVKLDHVGDFLTVIPALRRLRRGFPDARLCLLAAPRSAALRELVPEADEIIEFEFFFPNSRLGQRALSAGDYAALQRRLAPYRFDLAVDLRKVPDTRPVLRVTGAPWLAGFDRDGQFPWLDIVLEWERDPRGMRKRSHVGDDLLRLADAVVGAAQSDTVAAASLGVAADRHRRPAGRLVCVHPGAGMPIRRWPAPYFAELIRRLVEADDVDVVLIGQAEEAALAAEILSLVRRPDRVRSAVGEIDLAELPAFLAGADLFVGNNSGPHHLAARLGVPTVGIHSGTVDAREWGPVGPNAVAIRRDMVCSPCYFWNPADCRRDVACLTELRPAEVFELCDRLLAAAPPSGG